MTPSSPQQPPERRREKPAAGSPRSPDERSPKRSDPSPPQAIAPIDSATLWRMSGMGFVLVSEVLAALFIGWLLDWWLGTSPVFLIIGAIIGVVVALTNFIRQALKESRAGDRNRRSAAREGGSGRDRR